MRGIRSCNHDALSVRATRWLHLPLKHPVTRSCSRYRASLGRVNVTTFPLGLTAACAGHQDGTEARPQSRHLPRKGVFGTEAHLWSLPAHLALLGSTWQRRVEPAPIQLLSSYPQTSLCYPRCYLKWGDSCPEPKPGVWVAAAWHHLVPAALPCSAMEKCSTSSPAVWDWPTTSRLGAMHYMAWKLLIPPKSSVGFNKDWNQPGFFFPLTRAVPLHPPHERALCWLDPLRVSRKSRSSFTTSRPVQKRQELLARKTHQWAT